MREKRQFEVGRILHIQDDSFPDKESGEVKHMTRVKFYFGEGATAGIEDVNYMWKGLSKPKFLARCQQNEMAVLPIKIKAFNGDLRIQGDSDMEVSEEVWKTLLAGRK